MLNNKLVKYLDDWMCENEIKFYLVGLLTESKLIINF